MAKFVMTVTCNGMTIPITIDPNINDYVFAVDMCKKGDEIQII